MVTEEAIYCPDCHAELKYYDSVKRILKTRYGRKKLILIRRLYCEGCKKYHREIPEFIFPYKHYEKEIILGVVEGLIDFNTIGFEDYPSELTMIRWKKTIDISCFG